MTSTTTSESPDQALPADPVADAQAVYDNLLRDYEQVLAGRPSPGRILEQTRIRTELEEAARRVEDAKASQRQAENREQANRREQARQQLADTETELLQLAAQAESVMAQLSPLLEQIRTVGRTRYGVLATLNGRAQHHLIPDSHILGWLRWRLAGLESLELGRPLRHQRAPLAVALGVNPDPSTEPAKEST